MAQKLIHKSSTRRGEYAPVGIVLADGSTRELGPDQAALVELALRDDDTLSPAEASKLLGVSRPMVSKWIKEGVLPDAPVGAHHRIPRQAVLDLKQARLTRERTAMDSLAAAKAGDAGAARSVALAKVAAAQAVAARRG